jgi:hypothetical protein
VAHDCHRFAHNIILRNQNKEKEAMDGKIDLLQKYLEGETKATAVVEMCKGVNPLLALLGIDHVIQIQPDNARSPVAPSKASIKRAESRWDSMPHGSTDCLSPPTMPRRFPRTKTAASA